MSKQNLIKYQKLFKYVDFITHRSQSEDRAIAEEIETDAEKQILQGLNYEYGQGYFFAKPLAASDATQLLIDKINYL